MTKEDLKRIEDQANVSFKYGRIIGKKVNNATKRTAIYVFIILASIVVSIGLFIYGFFNFPKIISRVVHNRNYREHLRTL